MGNLRQKYTEEDWEELVEKSALKKRNNLKPFELYLLILGERSADYAYTPELIYENISYFRICWADNLSCYKALEFFSEYLDEKIL